MAAPLACLAGIAGWLSGWRYCFCGGASTGAPACPGGEWGKGGVSLYFLSGGAVQCSAVQWHTVPCCTYMGVESNVFIATWVGGKGGRGRLGSSKCHTVILIRACVEDDGEGCSFYTLRVCTREDRQVRMSISVGAAGECGGRGRRGRATVRTGVLCNALPGRPDTQSSWQESHTQRMPSHV